MSKITNLEKQKLAELHKILAPVKNSHTDNSDSIDDFIFQQFDIETEEAETLAAARKHFEIEKDAMLEVFDIVNMLVEHFDV